MRNPEDRIVITGMGLVSPVGNTVDEFWSALRQGKSGISPVTLFDASAFPTRIAGEVRNFDGAEYAGRKASRRMDRFAQFAVAAACMAVEDSGLAINDSNRSRVGVVIGTGIGGLHTLEQEHETLLTKGPDRVSPFLVPMLMCNSASGYISIHFGVFGPNASVVTACAAAGHSISQACDIIRNGDADVVITGGAEAAVTPVAFAGFCSMKALSRRNDEPEKASRPFDADRDGFVMGEGAGVVIAERLSHALDRNADILAELAGYGITGDGCHITAMDPDGKGAVMAMQTAMKRAGVSPSEIDYINAHGTSTEINDRTETLAVKKAFGKHAGKLAVSSTKSMTGHLLGASGGIELIASVLAIQNSAVPPTINYTTPDPDCDLDYVPNQCREQPVNVVMTNSFGFGGHNACLIVRRFFED
ncbi:MAG: beta-ketoacyl-[acyl-carrier-protein] synthase II [Armatimonadetes bacterium CG2_30_59_28]|nr:beta-ketoacyl-ACP synthase II [Armatimonadota bacterium]OIO90800.1 MAG: beta-ketoacyl-[acyl-carrier-protein] synthase II [Armatimonadetes bacterium CG2_30_59_28]PIU67519.1 MAG: beta-ketoacyl-[acyl-carrier-protein] synthase II [Armatimonadetes bacterium CG07_land_8_20_14_0_80_59_28]PIX45129.1 MAG: beta-ketoacyl-[acyl-carrier-protein] synthase II [Armatimonadetes bacterium CG_4_8_14_3_um_filter_58_9]PIY40219.1 MAG: beta-ketoacyl-[acyl-carrier-protein] synthase II [Armatimonadetes bacterium CG_